MTAPAAVGIHDHPYKKLGALPEDTSRAKVAIAEFFSANAVPTPPLTDQQPDFVYPMDHNDEAGDCVVAAGDHLSETIIKLLTGSYVNWDDDFLLRAYQQQNPGFKTWADAGGPNDNGMIIAAFLDWGIKEGLWLAYGKIDVANPTEMKSAIDIGLAIITGETLQVAQQEGKVWSYVKGSAVWGGHCTDWAGYNPNPQTVTWGESDYTMDESFVTNQVSEAYFVLFQAHVDHPTFRDNFDLAGFAAAVKSITNGKVIVPVTPSPTPPAPTPPSPNPFPVDPDADQDDLTLAAAMKVYNSHPHIGPNETMKKANVAWLAAKGL